MATERIFRNIPVTPPDAIFAMRLLIEQDKREGLIDATVGELFDEDGKRYFPSSVEKAFNRIGLGDRGYITASKEGWYAHPGYVRGSARIVFGKEAAGEMMDEGRLVATAAPGGTGALRVFKELLKDNNPDAKILLSDPGYPNHTGIFKPGGFEINLYPHLQGMEYGLQAHLDAIQKSDPNTIVLLHAGRTHNPTGDNPKSAEEWEMLAKAIGDRFVLWDAAYLGLGEGLEEDALGIRVFREQGVRMAIALSNSKNGGLYGLRAGLLLMEMPSTEDTVKPQRYLNGIARAMYSNSPSTGQELMGTVYEDPELLQLYIQDLKEPRSMLKNRRKILVDKLGGEFDFVNGQVGLFSLVLPRNPDAVARLRTKDPYYLLDNGRLCFGTVTSKDMPRLAEGIKAVL